MKLIVFVLVVCAVLGTAGLALVLLQDESIRRIYKQLEGSRNGAGYQ